MLPPIRETVSTTLPPPSDTDAADDGKMNVPGPVTALQAENSDVLLPLDAVAVITEPLATPA